MPSELPSHHLWWHGPTFLVDSSLEPPRYIPTEPIQIEANAAQIENTLPGPDKFALPNASVMSLKRTIACCLRFSQNCKSQKKHLQILTGQGANY